MRSFLTLLCFAAICRQSTANDRAEGKTTDGDWFGHDGALQTEAYANPKQNEVRLQFVQIVGPWDHPFKSAWRRVAGIVQ